MTAAARWITGFFIVIPALLAIHAEVSRIIHEHGLWDFGSFVASGRAASEGADLSAAGPRRHCSLADA